MRPILAIPLNGSLGRFVAAVGSSGSCAILNEGGVMRILKSGVVKLRTTDGRPARFFLRDVTCLRWADPNEETVWDVGIRGIGPVMRIDRETGRELCRAVLDYSIKVEMERMKEGYDRRRVEACS